MLIPHQLKRLPFTSTKWRISDYPADGEGKQDVLNALAAYGLQNVDYKVTAIGGDEYYDKLNILAVSGSLPDYMNIDMVTMTNFSDQG